MPTTVEEILRSFKELPDDEKERLFRELLRWSAQAPQPALSDDELTAAADEIFLGYDRDERESE